MALMRDTRRFSALLAFCTFAWLIVYFPPETYVTWSIAGVRGWLYSSYLLNIAGMALMLWSAVSARRAQAIAPGLLAAGWAWTAATFWRATSDRYWWVSQGRSLYAGPVELWLAPLLTALALVMFVASLALLLRAQRTE